MSPEQSQGQTLSAASDIFFLGIVVHELSTGLHPFESGSILETVNAESQGAVAPSTLNPFLTLEWDASIL
jgi:serine/threonine protein kinase